MAAKRRPCQISHFQATLLFLIFVAYFRIFFGNVFDFNWSNDCDDGELSSLEYQLTKLKSEKLGWLKLIQESEHAEGISNEKEVIFSLADWQRSMTDCVISDSDAEEYLTYDSMKECPDDWKLVEKINREGNCYALPRRSCFAPLSPNYSEPFPYPTALWSSPKKENLKWHGYRCRNVRCLARKDRESFGFRKASKNIFKAGSAESFYIQKILALKNGTIRVGLDVGGKTGNFAARMAAHNVIILTTSTNTEAPYLSFLALRGLIGLQLAENTRLPFPDSSLDLIHSRKSLDHLPLWQFEMVLYDWERVLRQGGLFFIEEFTLPGDIYGEYLRLLRAFRYVEHVWHDDLSSSYSEGEQRTLTAILEKAIGQPGK